MQARAALFCQFFVGAEHANYSLSIFVTRESEMLYSETQNHSTDSFQKAPFCKFTLRLWLSVSRVTSTCLPGTSFSSLRASSPHPLSNYVSGSHPIGRCRHLFNCSHFSTVKKGGIVSKHLWNCQYFSQAKVSWSVYSSVLFGLHFRLNVSWDDKHLRFFFGILIFCCSGFLLFRVSFISGK